MDIAQSLDRLSLKLDNLDNNGLLHLLTSLEKMITKTRDILSRKVPFPPTTPGTAHPSTSSSLPPKPKAAPTFEELFSYSSNLLQDSLMTQVHQHLKGLKYHPNHRAPNGPEIYLYGEHPYEYNKQSSEVSPTPILCSRPMVDLLIAVNGALETNYNSMLVNKYKDLHCHLGPHKDNEKSLDPSSPISAISFGATRRFNIALNGDKNSPKHTVNLESRSLCTMLPGFQETYYHSIAPGRKSKKKERGIRYSITFRRILAKEGDEEQEVHEEAKEEDVKAEEEAPQQEITAPDTLVFGSSLTKELDATLLSKYNKKFKVYPHSGARVNDIAKDIKRAGENRTVDPPKVTTVFLVCGGNDVGNLRKDADISDVYLDYENLVKVAKDVFPAANISIISLIPRHSRYNTHIDNMYEMNKWLDRFSREQSIRFVDIFSHFLIKSPHSWSLNEKLFCHDHIHFNTIGNSVLAKVLIGVANRPH